MRETMLIFHFIGLAMGVGVSFAHAFLGKAISKMDRNEAIKFRTQTKALSAMGYIGILLLVISGIYLIIPYWVAIMSFPFLILKLVLVFILIVLILLIGKITRKNDKIYSDENIKRIEILGKIAFLIGLTIVVVAVNVFT